MSDALRDILDRALASQFGIKITGESVGHAISLRHRLNKLRQKDREISNEIYPEGHPARGTSAYDDLVFRLDKRVVIIQRILISEVKIEDLKEDEIKPIR